MQSVENSQDVQHIKKRGRKFTGKAVTSFRCEYCNRTYRCRGANSFHVSQHYETNKCRYNRTKYYEIRNIEPVVEPNLDHILHYFFP